MNEIASFLIIFPLYVLQFPNFIYLLILLLFKPTMLFYLLCHITLHGCSIVQRFNVSIEHLKNIADFTSGVVHELTEESRKLQSHATQIDEIQTISIADFRKAYEVHFQNLICRVNIQIFDGFSLTRAGAIKFRCREAYC